MFKKLMINGFFPFWYKVCCHRRIKNIALFIETKEKKISTNFTGIIAYIKRNGIKHNDNVKTDAHFLGLGKCSTLSYLKNCLCLMPKLASAKYVFINDSTSVIAALKLRKGTRVIQTWHGCGALKKFGYSSDDKEKNYGNEDIVTVSSERVVDYYSKSMGISTEKIYPIGVPRSDVYFQDTYKEKCANLREEILKGRNKKIVLYAPTFRGNDTKAIYSQGLNLDLMYKHLGQEYIIISKFHNTLKPETRQYRHRDFYYDVTDRWTIEEAMGVCDVLITDYSCLIFEYSLLGKPVIFYAYDLNEYSNERGFFIDYKSEMPGVICESTLDIIKVIKNGCFDVGRMNEFKNKYMEKCDGHSTKRLIELIAGEHYV